MIGFDVKRSGDGKDMRLALGSFKYRTYVGAKARNTDLQERPLCRSSSTEHRIAAAPRRRAGNQRNWFRQLLSAVNHFQNKGVCHCNLCMENILMDEGGWC